MSPTYFAIQKSASEKRAEKARQAGDFSEMHKALAEMVRLDSAYYGKRQHGSLAYSVRSPRP